MDEITHIPIWESIFKDPFKDEIDYHAWELAYDLTEGKTVAPVSYDISDLYHFGFYKAQVRNGGHAQLVHNMDVQFRDPNIPIHGFVAMATRMGAPEFQELGRAFAKWIRDNPEEAQRQTGFDGGIADAMYEFDNWYSDINDGLRGALSLRLENTTDPRQASYITEVLGKKLVRTSNLCALEMLWVLNSGILRPVPDGSFESTFDELFEPNPP